MNSKEKALDLFKNGYNCAQAVVCAYGDRYNLDRETARQISGGFGFGIAGSKNTCGAVSGMVMVASLHTGSPADPAKKTTYPVVREMLEAFQARNDYIDCGSLLAHKDKTLINGKQAGCIKCVEDCCDIIEEFLYGDGVTHS